MGWPSLSLGKWEEVEGKRAGTFAMQLSAYFTAGGCGFNKIPSSIVILVSSPYVGSLFTIEYYSSLSRTKQLGQQGQWS